MQEQCEQAIELSLQARKFSDRQFPTMVAAELARMVVELQGISSVIGCCLLDSARWAFLGLSWWPLKIRAYSFRFEKAPIVLFLIPTLALLEEASTEFRASSFQVFCFSSLLTGQNMAAELVQARGSNTRPILIISTPEQILENFTLAEILVSASLNLELVHVVIDEAHEFALNGRKNLISPSLAKICSILQRSAFSGCAVCQFCIV